MIWEGDLNCPLEVDYQVIMQDKEFLIHKTVPTSFTVSLSEKCNEIQEYGLSYHPDHPDFYHYDFLFTLTVSEKWIFFSLIKVVKL